MTTCLFRTRPGRRVSGFTLIELMVAVAIVAILSAVALPAYTQYIQKARRADAKNALLDLAAREERFYSVNNQYTNSGTALGYASAFPINITSGGTAYYTLQVTAVAAGSSTAGPTFTAQAQPAAGAQSSDACGTYQITQLGAQTNISNTLASSSCW